MSLHFKKAAASRQRIVVPGLLAGMARADAGTPTLADVMAKIAEVQTAHNALRAANDAAIADLKAGRDDVVTREKVAKITDEVEKLTSQCAELNNKLVAASNAGGEPGETAEVTAHRKAFRQFIRKGVKDGLGELEVRAALTTDSDPDGGFVVPVEIDRAITRVLGADNGMRSVASVQAIGTDTFKKFKNLGGAGAGWVAEKDARPATSTPTLSALEFFVHEMYASPVATQKMLDDAFVNVEEWLANEVAVSFADLEGAAFVSGDGVGKPFGLFGSGYTKVASTIASPSAWGKIGFTVTGAAADFITPTTSANPADAILNLVQSLKPGYLPGSNFLMNRDTRRKVMQFKDAQGLYLWQPPSQIGKMDTLFGYGIAIDDNVSSVGAANFIMAFGDFKQGYLILDRFGSRLLRDPYTNKPNVLFYTTKRVGGGVQDYHAVKLLKCST